MTQSQTTRDTLTERVRLAARMYDRLVLQWGTGVGKSRAAIAVMNQMLELNPDARILLLVNENAHKSMWFEQFRIWGLKKCDITMECYASLKNYSDTSWDMIVADEAHHLGSVNRMSILETVKTDRFICLSATLPNDVVSGLTQIYGVFFIDSISLQESISYGILPKPEIQVVKLELDNTKACEEIVTSWGPEAKRVKFTCQWNERFKFLKKATYPASELHIKCTQRQKYDWITEQYEYWKKRYMMGKMQFAKNKWLHLGSERKRFLGESKTSYAYNVMGKVGRDKRMLCFCTSILQAEALGGKDAIHSHKSPAENDRIIQSFNSLKTNGLYAVGMLQEGANLKDVDWGMIIQLDGYPRGWIQKTGRMIRSEKPRIVILYYKDTQDEEYLKNVIEGVDSSYIKFYKL